MADQPDIDPREFRDTLGNFATGVVVVTGLADGVPMGFAAQSFTSVSIDPPLVAVCPALTSVSWPPIRAAGSFAVNILSAAQRPLCEVFARSGGDKFSDLPWRQGTTGAPLLEGVIGWIECDLHAEHSAGDHTIAVGRVRGLKVEQPDLGGLLFFRGGYGEFSAS